METFILKKDEWLSEELGKDAFNLVQDDSGEKLSEILADIPSSSFITIKSETNDIETHIELGSKDFFLADTSITFKMPIEQVVDLENDRVRAACTEDRKDVGSVARLSFIYSRFHQDPFIDTETANNIKVHWAENFFRSRRGTHMLVAASNNRVVGFNQIIETTDSLIIDLIAVLPEFQNHGFGRVLVLRMKDLAPTKDVIVGTQIANHRSIYFYQSLGFKFHKSTYVFHRHGSN